jgi:hypothetical protein
MKLKKNMKIASDLKNILGRVIHEGRKMITETTADEKHAMRLNALAKIIGGSKSSFIPVDTLQP